jgi:hypothetical protein
VLIKNRGPKTPTVMRGFFSSTNASSSDSCSAAAIVVIFLSKSGHKESDERQQAIWVEMVKVYEILIGITTQGIILPVMETLNLEHIISERKILEVCNISPASPYNREELCWKREGLDKWLLPNSAALVLSLSHIVRFKRC